MPHCASTERFYAAALALQDERLIRQDYAAMLRGWAAVYRSDGLEGKAAVLEATAASTACRRILTTSALKLPGGFQPVCFAFIPLAFCTGCPISCLPNSTLLFPKNHVPGCLPVKLYFRETTAFQLGVSDFHLEEGSIRAHDLGKTVCDLFRLRAKTGEVVKEVVKNYLQRPARLTGQRCTARTGWRRRQRS